VAVRGDVRATSSGEWVWAEMARVLNMATSQRALALLIHALTERNFNPGGGPPGGGVITIPVAEVEAIDALLDAELTIETDNVDVTITFTPGVRPGRPGQ